MLLSDLKRNNLVINKLLILYPIINPAPWIIIWIIFIVIIRLASMVSAFIKYTTFASIHTIGNKVTGIVIFISPLLLPFVQTVVPLSIICAIASISAIEELIIQLVSSRLQLDRKSLFSKL